VRLLPVAAAFVLGSAAVPGPVLLVTDVGDGAQPTMPAAVWRRLATDYLGARGVTVEDGTALPDEARCRAAHAQYAVLATFDRAMRLPGLAQENDRLYGVARFTVRNCATGAIAPPKIVRVESEPLREVPRGEDEAVAERAWESAIRTAFARDPLVFATPAPVAHASAAPAGPAASASPSAHPARIARVVSIEGNDVFIDNTGAFSQNQVLRAYADRNGKPYANPVELVVVEISRRFVIAAIVGRSAPRIGDEVEALTPTRTSALLLFLPEEASPGLPKDGSLSSPSRLPRSGFRQGGCMNKRLVFAFVFVTVAGVIAAGGAASADSGVARITLVDGDVGVARGDSPDPVAAALNGPLLAGDALLTGTGRSEFSLARGARIRLAPNTQVRAVRLDGDDEFQLGAGTIEVRLMRSAPVQIDTPLVVLVTSEPGAYKVSVEENDNAVVAVTAGSVTVRTPSGDRKLATGDSVMIGGTTDAPEIGAIQPPGRDDFDAFNSRRDTELQRLVADRGAPYDVDGVEMLSPYGHWASTEDYGRVWVPNVSPDWTPYSDGRFVWEDYYGWTWVGAEPWGWAPYHYGRWLHSDALGWAWYPGERAAWSPALVGFVVSGQSVAWVPLAPRERLYPWWGEHRFATYARLRGAEFRNAAYRNAIVAISADRFARGEFSRPGHLQARDLREAMVAHGMLKVVPTRESLRLAARPFHGVSSFKEHAAFAGHQVARRESFEVQRRSVAAFRVPAASARTEPRAVSGTVQPAKSLTSPVFGPRVTKGTATSSFGAHPSAAGTTDAASFGRQRSTMTGTTSFGPRSSGGAASTGTTTTFIPRGKSTESTSAASTGTTCRGTATGTYGRGTASGYSSTTGTYRAPTSTTGTSTSAGIRYQPVTNRVYGGGATTSATTQVRQYQPVQQQRPVQVQALPRAPQRAPATPAPKKK
jgi:hypothetical protein